MSGFTTEREGYTAYLEIGAPGRLIQPVGSQPVVRTADTNAERTEEPRGASGGDPSRKPREWAPPPPVETGTAVETPFRPPMGLMGRPDPEDIIRMVLAWYGGPSTPIRETEAGPGRTPGPTRREPGEASRFDEGGSLQPPGTALAGQRISCIQDGGARPKELAPSRWRSRSRSREVPPSTERSLREESSRWSTGEQGAPGLAPGEEPREEAPRERS